MRAPLVIILLFLSCFSCQSDASDDESSKNNLVQKTILFLDKSASIGLDPTYAEQKYEEQIRLILQSNIQKAGDHIEVFYVHDNTLKGKCLHLESKVAPVDPSNLNPTDIEAAELDYALQIGKERLSFEKKIGDALQVTNTELSNQMTDLGATLAIINERNTGDVNLTAYYFSDMLESTREGLNFHKKKPSSADQAKSWASQEAEKRKDMNLQGVSVIMVLPFNPLTTAQKNDPLVTLYWKTLFENLGILSVEEL